MIAPEFPSNEAERLLALHALHILDTPYEERYDRLTRLAQHLLNMPIALISLVDSDRQWFKSCQGLSAVETPRNISFCGHAILDDTAMVIPDALRDPRFADNPLVTGPPYIRFYAGYPLKADNGSKLGTLCVVDTKPNHFSPADLNCLADLALLVQTELNFINHWVAQSALQDQINYLSAILDNVPDGIITLDEQGRIQSFNKAAEHIYGYAATELIDRDFCLLMPEACRPLPEAAMQGNRQQLTGLRKDGAVFQMELAVTTLQFAGKCLYNVIVRDLSAQIRIERIETEFISTVSHELRTPLTAIRGALGLLAAGAVGAPDQRPLLQIAHKNSERLCLLVNNIIDMEQIQAGKMSFDIRPVKLLPVLLQALDDAQADYPAVKLTCQSIEAMLKVDSLRLSQVLANLLSNAAKATPAGGQVVLGLTREQNMLRITVTDNGPGIAEAFRSRIFQKFTQTDSTDTRANGGIGLGLSLSKALVMQMHGSIGFDSNPGVQTVFYLLFPEYHSAPD